jgi:predicted amidohydrolase YtcJ
VQRVTLAVVNGKVWGAGPRATAVAVVGDRIAATGIDSDIRGMAAPRARVVDAAGATILPAFNDAHVHFLMASRSLGELDLYGAETQAEVERRVKDYARRHAGPWIVGRGWFYSAFPSGMPSVEVLDRLVPDRPAYIQSYDAHTGWANSRALRIAGAPPGEVLKEAAMLQVTSRIPARSRAEDVEALRQGMRLAASRGVVSVQEAGEGLDQLPLWETLLEEDALTLRVRLAFDMTPGHGLEEWGRRLELYGEASRRARDPWITTGILKAFADGVVESRTASLLEPYTGGDDRGAPLWGGDELAAAVRLADARGWQVQIHAIGDAAIRQALDAFEDTTAGRRHRVEHIEAPADSEVARFGRLGVIASMQPQHAEPNRNLFGAWAPNLGPERAARGWPWRSIAQAGGRLAFGTDWPVVPLDPAASLHVAVNRQTRDGEPADGWLPEERMELADAVAAWTSGSSYAEHAEGLKGTIRAGMLADIAVLDRDIDAVDPPELAALRVSVTVAGGRVVYEK